MTAKDHHTEVLHMGAVTSLVPLPGADQPLRLAEKGKDVLG